jgi:hypothetical protein
MSRQSGSLSHKPHSLCPSPSRLTAQNLSKLDSSGGLDPFENEKRSGNIQLAGEQLGFHLELECYKNAMTSINDWCKTQYTLFEERPISKDPQDVAAMDVTTRCFDVTLREGSI